VEDASNGSNWLEEIDYLRAVAIVAVISIHSSVYFLIIPFASIVEISDVLICTLSNFAVPLFVLISGFVLFKNYSGAFSVPTFYKKRFLSVIPPYLAFSTFYILLSYVSAIRAGQSVNPTVASILAIYLTGTSSVPLWFVVLIVQLYILYPLIVKVYHKITQKYKRGALYLLSASLVAQIAYNTAIFDHSFLYRFFLSNLFYFVLGIVVYANYASVKQKLCAINAKTIACLVLLTVTPVAAVTQIQYFSRAIQLPPYSYYLILSPLYSIPLIMLCAQLSLKLKDTNRSDASRALASRLKKIAAFSFGIYLIHPFFSNILGFSLLPKLGINWNMWLFYPLLLAMTLLLSYYAILVLYKLPLSRYTIGIPRARVVKRRERQSYIKNCSHKKNK